MWTAEHLLNLTRDPTQYFAPGNKMKQISEMKDYIKLGKEANTARRCYWTLLSVCKVIQQWWWKNEHCTQVKILVLAQISVVVTLCTPKNCTQMDLGLNPGWWLTIWARKNTRIRREYCSMCHVWVLRCCGWRLWTACLLGCDARQVTVFGRNVLRGWIVTGQSMCI